MSAAPGPTPWPEFPRTPAEAGSRYAQWRERDPFPDIEPALLNSADLLDYVATVGMLYPIEATRENSEDWIKPASCAVACKGEFLRYELDRGTLELRPEPVRGALAEGQRLWLLPNTI